MIKALMQFIGAMARKFGEIIGIVGPKKPPPK
jgi:hypothetical protein